MAARSPLLPYAQDVPAEPTTHAIRLGRLEALHGDGLLGAVLFTVTYVLRRSGQFILSGSGLATTLTAAIPFAAMLTVGLFGFALVRRTLGHSPSFAAALVALWCVWLPASWSSLIA